MPEDNLRLFDELGDGAAFPKPDIVCDFDVDGLAPISDDSQDFVIASHVIEHLADPLRFLDEIHRVLRPEGACILLVPERHRSFDHPRAPTPLEHLIAEHEAGVTVVDDEHIREFLENAEESSIEDMPADPEGQREFYEWHRLRSIHAHCWNQHEFLGVLLYAIREMGQRWEFVDGVVPDEEGDWAIEF